MLPIRERLLQAIADRIDAVRSLPGFDISMLPLTVLSDGDEEATETDYDVVRVDLSVTATRVVAKRGDKTDAWHEDAGVELAQLIADVYAGDETFGGLALAVEYSGGRVGVGSLPDGAEGYEVQADFTVRYAFVHGNPFSNQREV